METALVVIYFLVFYGSLFVLGGFMKDKIAETFAAGFWPALVTTILVAVVWVVLFAIGLDVIRGVT